MLIEQMASQVDHLLRFKMLRVTLAILETSL